MARNEHEINTDLRKGEIPPEFSEQYSLVDSNDNTAIIVSTYIKSLVDRILSVNGVDPTTRPFRYLFSSSDAPRAFITPNLSAPMIVVSAGMLKLMDDVSELVGVLAHEAQHYNDRDFTNSKTQEWHCDQAAVDTLEKANLNPYGLSNLLKKLPRYNKQTISDYVSGYVDEHPDIDLRIRDQENKITIDISEGKSAATFSQEPIAAHVLRAAENVQQMPDAIEQKLQNIDYEELPVADKIMSLTEIYKNDISGLDSFYSRRLSTFHRTLGNLTVDVNNPDQKTALDDLVDRFLIPHTSQGEDLYRTLSQTIAPKDTSGLRFSAIGPIADLADEINAFIGAATKEDAEHHARSLNKIASKYAAHSFHFGFIELPAFAQLHDQNLSATKGIDVPWTPHIAWAKESDQREIACALYRLGIQRDPRLPKPSHQERETCVPLSYRATINLHPSRQLRFDSEEKATISDLAFYQRLAPHDRGLYKKQLLESEKQRIKLRDNCESDILPDVEWHRMETDFKGFVDDYLPFLLPELTVAFSAENNFAKAFLRHANDMIADDRAANPDHADMAENVVKFRTFFAKTIPNKFIEMNIRSFSHIYIPLGGQFAYSLPLGIAPDHPFIQYVLDDPLHIFIPQEKLKLVDYAAYLKTKNIDVDEQEHLAIDPHRLFDLKDDKTLDDLLAFFKDTQFTNDSSKRKADYGGSYYNAVLTARLHHVMKNAQHMTPTPQQMHAMQFIADTINLPEETKPFFQRQETARAKDDLQKEASALDAVNTYTLYMARPHNNRNINNRFAENASLRNQYEAVIKEKTGDLILPEDKKKIAETLLFKRRDIQTLITPVSYKGMIPDLEFRHWANQLLVEVYSADLGQDDGSTAYFEKYKATIKHLCEKTQGVTIYDVLPKLADAVNAQPQAAYHTRDTWQKVALSSATNAGLLGGSVEATFDLAASDPLLRLAYIDFLSAPCTDKDALAFGKLVESLTASKLERTVSSADLRKLLLIGTEGADLTNDVSNISDAKLTEYSKTFHKNFWLAPGEARTWYLEKIIFPLGQDDDKVFKEAMYLVLDKTLPGKSTSLNFAKEARKLSAEERKTTRSRLKNRQTHEVYAMQDWNRELGYDQGSPEEKNAIKQFKALKRDHKIETAKLLFHQAAQIVCHPIEAIARCLFKRNDQTSLLVRQIAESYVEIVPKNEQRLLLGTLMASCNTALGASNKGEKMSAGKMAALVLSQMDEMGGKVLQAMDSHPDVPEDIKKDIKFAKSDYQKPLRWKALEWYEKYGIKSEAPEDKVAHYGAVIGSGSMGYSLVIQTEDGKEHVVTSLRENAIPRIELGADKLIKTARTVAQKNHKLASAPDIAEEARRSAAVEVWMHGAKMQGDIAYQVYNGLKTSSCVNDKTYTFEHKVPKISAYSQGSKRADFAKGLHFSDLPENTQEQKDYKHAIAIQLFGVEVLNLLAGKPCDKDRHGKNQKIKSGSFYHFDFGMTALVNPTEEQKRAFVRVVVSTLRDCFIFKKDMASSFEKNLKKAKGSKETRDFLSGTRRQILALGDFNTYLTKEDTIGIVKTVLSSGRVDPVIQDELNTRTAAFKGTLAKTVDQAPDVFSFDDSQCVKIIQMPTLSAADMKIIRGEIFPTRPDSAPSEQKTPTVQTPRAPASFLNGNRQMAVFEA